MKIYTLMENRDEGSDEFMGAFSTHKKALDYDADLDKNHPRIRRVIEIEIDNPKYWEEA